MANSLKLLIGLSASVGSDPVKGFYPLPAQHGIPLLAECRWRGFAAAINHGFAEKLVMLGGVEKLSIVSLPDMTAGYYVGRIEGELVYTPRGLATITGLNASYHVPLSKMKYIVTEGNTSGNVDAVKEVLKKSALKPEEVGFSTNLYHLPRAFMDLHTAGFQAIKPIPAEAFWLATAKKGSPERESMMKVLEDEFGESALTKRTVMEINGAADKLLGEYAAFSR